MAKDKNSSANIKELISADPHSIKLALVNLMEKRLGTEADTFEAGFGGYLIQALTLLTSDTLSSLAFSYNEAFTNKCTLRSSANDLGKMFDYTIKNAKPCTGNMTVQIAFPTQTYETYSTKIANGSLCSESDIQYMVNGTYEITMSYSSCYIKRRDPNTLTVTNVPYTTVSKNGKKFASFNVNVWQIKVFEHTFTFSNVEYQKFYDVNISGFTDSIYSMDVGCYITQENESYTQFIKFKKIENIYSATPTDKVYSFILGRNNTATVRFGNGIFGYQPEDGQQGKIIIYTTMGSKGAVIPNTLTLNTTLKDIKSNTNLEVSSSNLSSINNGEDEEDLETLKANIINQISMAKRLVTEDDYKKYNSITNISSISLYPMLLRRDTNVNEIDLFSVFYGEDGKPVPTTSLSLYVDKNESDDDLNSPIILNNHVYRIYYKRGPKSKLLISMNKLPSTPTLSNGEFGTYEYLYYIDDDYSESGTSWSGHGGHIAKCYNILDNGNEQLVWKFFDPKINDNRNPLYIQDNYLWHKVEYVCPYNIFYDETSKRAIYEYIPSKLTLATNLEYLTSYSSVEMSIKNTIINVLPENAMEYSNLNVSHFNIITTIDYNANMNFENIKAVLKIESMDGNPNSNISPTIENEYDMRILSNNEFDNSVQMVINVPVEDISYVDNGVLVLTTEVSYLDNLYNTYKRKVVLMDGEDSISKEYLNVQLEYTYNTTDSMTMPQSSPLISTVEFGINTILFNWDVWGDGIYDYGYEVVIYMYKLNTVNSARIRCYFEFGGRSYDPYAYGVGGNGSILVYKIHIPYRYDPPHGESIFKVKFDYDFENNGVWTIFSTYTGSVTARQKMTNTIWSTVLEEENPDFNNENEFKIYKIPVIEKNYYEKNYDYLESKILYAFSEVNSNFNKYKMLTDSVNIKFANTSGITDDLAYNKFDETQIDSINNFRYGEWAWDNPPTISVKVVLDTTSSARSSFEIVEECKNVILTFLTIKTTGFKKSIIRSEIARFIHDSIPEVVSCDIFEPTRDILYVFDQSELPSERDKLLTYVPDFIWIDKDKISVEAISIPTI